MAQMNAGLILAQQHPNLINTLAASGAAAGVANRVKEQNAFRQMAREHGAGILAGNPESMNAFAAMDPVGAAGMRLNRGADDRAERALAHGMRVDDERLTVAKAAGAREAAKWAHAKGAAELADAARKIEANVRDIGVAWALYEKSGDRRALEAALVRADMDPATPDGDIPAAMAFGEGTLTGFMEGAETLAPAEPADEYGRYAAEERAAGRAPLSRIDYAHAKKGETPSEADMEIGRLMSVGIPRETAVKIKEGVYTVSRHPVDGSVVVIDLANGKMVFDVGDKGAPPPAPPGDTPTAAGYDMPGAKDAFGAEGAIKGAVNKAADIAGAPVPYREVQDAQNDFAVLREDILSTIAAGYKRQPPSWLMQALRDLTPAAGSVFEGPEGAKSKLRALERKFDREIAHIDKQLKPRGKPEAKAELRANKQALEAARARVGGMLGAFAPSLEIRPDVAERMKAYE